MPITYVQNPARNNTSIVFKGRNTRAQCQPNLASFWAQRERPIPEPQLLLCELLLPLFVSFFAGCSPLFSLPFSLAVPPSFYSFCKSTSCFPRSLQGLYTFRAHLFTQRENHCLVAALPISSGSHKDLVFRATHLFGRAGPPLQLRR